MGSRKPRPVPDVAAEPADQTPEGAGSGGLASFGWFLIDILRTCWDFLRANPFITLLLTVLLLSALARTATPRAFGQKTLLIAGFMVAVVMLVGFVVSSYRNLQEKRKAFIEAKEKYDASQPGTRGGR